MDSEPPTEPYDYEAAQTGRQMVSRARHTSQRTPVIEDDRLLQQKMKKCLPRIQEVDKSLSDTIEQGIIDDEDYAKYRRIKSNRYFCCGIGFCKSGNVVPVGYYQLKNESQHVVRFIIKEVSEENLELVKVKKQGVAKVGVDFQGVNAGGMNVKVVKDYKKAEHKPQEFILTPQDFFPVSTNSTSIAVTLEFKVKDAWQPAYKDRQISNCTSLVALDKHYFQIK